MAGDDHMPPRFTVDELTDDQTATLALLGGVEVRPRRSVALVYDAPAGLAKLAPGLSRSVVKDHLCPVVEYRGALRMIMPNGDIHAVDDRDGA